MGRLETSRFQDRKGYSCRSFAVLVGQEPSTKPAFQGKIRSPNLPLICCTAIGDASAVPVFRLVFDLALVGFGVFQFVPRRENLGLAGEVQIANGAGELVC